MWYGFILLVCDFLDGYDMLNKLLLLIILVLIPSCVPLTTNSPMIIDFKKNLEIQAENNIKVAKVLDKVTEKIGLDVPSLSLEFKDALKQLQADNDKKYELLNGQIMEMFKLLTKVGLGSIGVPPAITNAGITATEAILGTGIVGGALKMGNDYLISRRRKQEHEQALDDIKEETEKEKEGLRLRLEREKAELKEKSMIKERTMAKLNPAYQDEWDKCNTQAIAELRANGKIS